MKVGHYKSPLFEPARQLDARKIGLSILLAAAVLVTMGLIFQDPPTEVELARDAAERERSLIMADLLRPASTGESRVTEPSCWWCDTPNDPWIEPTSASASFDYTGLSDDFAQLEADVLLRIQELGYEQFCEGSGPGSISQYSNFFYRDNAPFTVTVRQRPIDNPIVLEVRITNVVDVERELATRAHASFLASDCLDQ